LREDVSERKREFEKRRSKNEIRIREEKQDAVAQPGFLRCAARRAKLGAKVKIGPLRSE